MKELLLSELDSDQINITNALWLLESELFSSSEQQIENNTQQLETLINYCKNEIESIEDPLDKADRLIECLYVDTLLLDNQPLYWPVASHQFAGAMAFRSIAPTLKSLILLYVIRRCGFTCEAVFVPDEIMLRIICNDEYAIIFNVLDGKPINWFELEERIDTIENTHEPISLDIFSDSKLILQYLVSLKSSLIREMAFDLALKCVDIILSLSPEDPYHRRDRGFLLQQLDCYKVAFDDYQYFVDQCPKDPAAKLLEQQIKMFNQSDTVLH